MTGEKKHTHTALVTGATKRIGRAICLALAHNGINIIAHYNKSTPSEVEQIVREITSCGVKGWAVQADLAKEKDVHELIPTITANSGPFSILINNASSFSESSIASLSKEELDTTLMTNAVAPLLLSQAFAQQTKEGIIISLLDARISSYDKKHAAYHLSKLLLKDLTRMMALEFAPHIRVNGIAPGVILPPPNGDASFLEKISKTIPLERHGSVQNVTDAVVYLINNSFVSGEILFVDGAHHLEKGVYGNK
jgi:NAD(P)-dependent dehydrogenase (short-subunit alcohol dehydrogenase family)